MNKYSEPGKSHICLVNMPNVDIQCPSMALGLLKAILQRDGIKTKVFYGNLLFAEEGGFGAFKVLFMERGTYLGDWIFTDLIFSPESLDDENYVTYLRKKSFLFSRMTLDRAKKLLFSFRKKAKDFMAHFAEKILEENPEIVGCTSIFLQYFPSIALLKHIRNISPEIITIMGGPSCETILGFTTHKTFPWIDYVVSGEADDIVSPLIKSILKDGKNIPVEKLPGGVFGPLHREKGYPSGNLRAFKDSLTGLPVPDYDEYFETLQRCSVLKEIIVPSVPVETSRGCWWAEKGACTFCGDNGARHSYRKKPAENAIKEIDLLYEHYGVKKFVATDNIMDMTYFKTFLPELVKKGSPYTFFYEITSHLEKEHIKLLKEAGIIWIQPGIESLNSDILSLINKGLKAWHNIQLLKWCRQYGVRTSWNFLCGFPGEKDEYYEEMADFLPLLYHLQPPRLLNSIHFCRNSIYHNEPEKYGLKIRPHEIYSFLLPLSGDVISNIAFNFQEEGQIEKEQDELDFVIRSGFHKLKNGILRWKKCFWSDERPVLNMTVNNGVVTIEDTRPVSVKKCFTFSGLEAEIFIFCDNAPEKDLVIKNFKEKGYGEEEINKHIVSFLNNNLIMEIDKRLISLALNNPLDLPDEKENPAGLINESLET